MKTEARDVAKAHLSAGEARMLKELQEQVAFLNKERVWMPEDRRLGPPDDKAEAAEVWRMMRPVTWFCVAFIVGYATHVIWAAFQ
jgi:hypothetical protein